MFHKILFAGTILLCIGFAMLLNYFSQTSDLLAKYQKLGLVQSDIQYEKVEKSWGEQGLIFYQVQFPFINLPVRADSMNIQLKDAGMKLKLKNTRLNVTQGLKKMYGSEIMDNLNDYVPYKDFFEKILTSMAVMGIDEFIGDVSLNTVYSDAKTMRFEAKMTQENQPVLHINGVIHIPIVGAHQISDLWNGKVESIEVKTDESLFQKYIHYAKSRHFQLPQNIQKGIFKLKEAGLKLKNILR